MKEEDPFREIAGELGLVIRRDETGEGRQLLVNKINELLVNDFSRIVAILYRVDVSESKLKTILKENPDTDAGLIIADLLIERQEEKKRSRQQQTPKNNKIDEDEKW